MDGRMDGWMDGRMMMLMLMLMLTESNFFVHMVIHRTLSQTHRPPCPSNMPERRVAKLLCWYLAGMKQDKAEKQHKAGKIIFSPD